MEREQIEAEVKRLAPWYYRHDLDGVSTESTDPSDHHGHRVARLPEVSQAFLEGSSVLDVACNEGGFTFAAFDRGATRVTSFDVRAHNIEKARFVARIRGYVDTDFHVATCDSWLEQDPEPVDYVFLCGLLYHLEDPAQTIGQYARLARKGVFVTCVLNGGEDGYTPFPEAEGIGASANPDAMSQMPNTSRTILRAFQEHGFLPAYVAEDRTPSESGFWGGCSLLMLRNSHASAPENIPEAGEDLEFQLLRDPSQPGTSSVMLYNWLTRDRELEGTLRFLNPEGAEAHASTVQAISLPARVATTDGSSSSSMLVSVAIPVAGDQGAVHSIEGLVKDAASGQLLVRRRLVLDSV